MKWCGIRKLSTLKPHREFVAGDSHEKKEAQCCEPGSMHFDLTVLFSLDSLSSVLSFSF